ncbi:MAG: hypothetical protein KAR06_10350, partial [Deltaproteobacteria bacterium]|nr:hypothetical protein [Deltaproteobacteria bacterium]
QKGSFQVWRYDRFDLSGFLSKDERKKAGKELANQLSAKWERSFDVKGQIKGEETLRTIGSCDDLFSAREEGFSYGSVGAAGAYSYIGIACYALRHIVEGKTATLSALEELKLDMSITEDLPAEVAFKKSGKKGESWSDVEKLEFKGATGINEITFKSEGTTHLLGRIASGDFNDDGVSDVIIHLLHSVESSNDFNRKLYVLTRNSPDELLSVVAEYDVLD